MTNVLSTATRTAPTTKATPARTRTASPSPPDLYPTTLALEPGGTRQIKLRTASGGAQAIDVAYPTGTRYVSSDERIATVDEHGVITGLTAGRVTISVVHLTSETDGQGTVLAQGIGQSDITLTVQTAQLTDLDDSTPAPRSITVSATVGGAVRDATGETVLIGAGALAADTAVAIQRIGIDAIEALTGLALPAANGLQADRQRHQRQRHPALRARRQ